MPSSVRALVKAAVFDRVPGLRRRGPTTTRRVALTFDDGPDALTGEYLALLDRLGVPATFFVLGEAAARYPELVRAYLRGGHQLASHGYDHTLFTALSRAALLDQCTRTDAVLGGQLGGRSWVRPPHGALDAGAIVSLLAAHYTVALWSIDSLDHRDRDVDALVERCSSAHVHAGDVLLFHEGQPWTLAALPRIVEGLQAAGLECVTMHDLYAA